MARFSKNRPWDFGIKPSEYIESISDKLRNVSQNPSESSQRNIEAIHHFLNFSSLYILDGFYDLTKKTPDLDITIKDYEQDLFEKTFNYVGNKLSLNSITMEFFNDLSLSLILHNARPMGMIEFKKDFDAEKNLPQGLYAFHFTDFLNKQSHLQIRNDPYLPNVYYVSKQKDLIEEFKKFGMYINSLYESRSPPYGITDIQDLVNGICLGYPMADVIEGMPCDEEHKNRLTKWKQENNYHNNLTLLQHLIYPYEWSDKWNNQVGIKGEEHLQKVYKEVLTKSKPLIKNAINKHKLFK